MEFCFLLRFIFKLSHLGIIGGGCQIVQDNHFAIWQSSVLFRFWAAKVWPHTFSVSTQQDFLHWAWEDSGKSLKTVLQDWITICFSYPQLFWHQSKDFCIFIGKEGSPFWNYFFLLYWSWKKGISFNFSRNFSLKNIVQFGVHSSFFFSFYVLT